MKEGSTAASLQHEIEQFLFEEAYLIDERRLVEWLALFTEDAVYRMFVRTRRNTGAHAGTLPQAPVELLYEDDRRFLALRVRRLETGMAHSEKPPSITRHLITNVQAASEGDEVAARSNFQVYQARLEFDDQWFFGKREDRLRRVDGAWRIAKRTTVLDHIILPRTLTTFF